MKSVLLHTPHSSALIPEDALSSFVLTPDELQEEVLKMTDWFTDELFSLDEADRLVFGVSRLLVDPERFADDDKEVMAERGMGAVYTKTSDGRPLRGRFDREDLLGRYYAPHHQALSAWAEKALKEHGRCLIVDCHSFPSTPLPCDLDQSPKRPLFCIGTDPYHAKRFGETVFWIVSDICSEDESGLFDGVGPDDFVWMDRPYAGTIVPSQFFNKDPNVASVMVEVNRSLYMDEATGEKLPRFDQVKEFMNGLLDRISEYWSEKETESRFWENYSEERSQEILQEQFEKSTDQQVFSALLDCHRNGRNTFGSFLDSAIEHGPDSWQNRLLRASEPSLSDPESAVRSRLDSLELWYEETVDVEGFGEFSSTEAWLEIPGFGLVRVGYSGGYDFHVREVREGCFSEAEKKAWLDSSVDAFLKGIRG